MYVFTPCYFVACSRITFLSYVDILWTPSTFDYKNRVKITSNTFINKHCKILVSCSDKKRNCVQAHETACKPMELHASSANCKKAYGPALTLW